LRFLRRARRRVSKKFSSYDRSQNFELLEERRLLALSPVDNSLQWVDIEGGSSAFSDVGRQGGGIVYPVVSPSSSFTSLVLAGEVESNNTLATANPIANFGTGMFDDPQANVTGAITAGDLDFFSFTLAAGDIIGANVVGAGGTTVQLVDSVGTNLMTSSQNIGAFGTLPASSPLPVGGNANVHYVVPTDGTYAVRVSGGTGAYTLQLRAFRPVLEQEAPNTKQILYLDFDGAIVDAPSLFGTGNANANLSALTTFLPSWGLTPADQNNVIDAIVSEVEVTLSTHIRSTGNNGNFQLTGQPGEFDIEIRNSRDHADPFGLPNVSRVVIGGTIAQFGISTLGIASSIDVGNFELADTAVVLLDVLSGQLFPGSGDNINNVPRAPGVGIVGAIGKVVGQITAHEAGHFFGNFHTENGNAVSNTQDQGGNGVADEAGVGIDGLFGTVDDVSIRFVADAYESSEGFTGIEDTRNVISFGLATSINVPYTAAYAAGANVADDGQADTFRIVRQGNDLNLYINGGLVQTFPNGTPNVTIQGSSDDDKLIVDSSNGLIPVEIRFLGGSGFDSLDLRQFGGVTNLSSTINLGATPGSGQSVITDGALTQTVNFEGLEPITDSVPALFFNVAATPALASLLQGDNQINYTSSPLLGPDWGRVTVDNFEPIDFSNKNNLFIDSGAGSDQINLNNPVAPALFTPQNVTVFSQNFQAGLGPNESTGGAFTINNTNAPLNNGTLMMGHPAAYANSSYSFYQVTLDLTNAANAAMSFNFRAQIENFFDGFNVLASTGAIVPPAGLQTATSGLPYDAKDASIANIGPLGYDGNDVLASGTANFDLSAFDGQIVTLRFQFQSDSSITRSGINFDNLLVTGDVLVATGNMTGMFVEGGDPSGSDHVIINGTAGADAVTYQPTGLGSAAVTGLAVPINVTGAEHVLYHGQGGDDALTVDTLNIDGTQILTPGTAIDAGLLEFQNNTLLNFIASPLEFSHLGANGNLTLTDIARFDNLIYRATGLDDTLSVSATGVVNLNNRIPVNTPGIINLTLAGLDGDDIFNIAGNHNLTGITIQGGNPSASDVVNLIGAAGAIEAVTIAPSLTEATHQTIAGLGGNITTSGVEVIRYTGTGVNDTLTVDTGTGDDTVRVQGGNSRDVVTSNSLPQIEFTGLNTFLLNIQFGHDVATFATANLGGATGANYQVLSSTGDTLIVEGLDSGIGTDSFTVTNPAGSPTAAVTDNIFGVTVTELGTIGGFGRLQLNTLGGDDTVTVNVGATDVVGVPIVYDGGSGFDRLTVSGTPATAVNEVIYSPGPSNTAGRLRYENAGNATLMSIDFTDLEPVVDLVPAAVLTVNATNADNAINYTQGTVATNGLVSVDNFETIEFSAKTSLVINALAGSDTINLNNPTTPAGLTGNITVNGNDPTASDTVIVNGNASTNTVGINLTGPSSGNVTGLGPVINLATIEHLKYNGQGGDDALTVTSPSGLDFIEYTPGGVSAFASGLVTMNDGFGAKRLPFSFEQIGFSGNLTFAEQGGGRLDDLWVNGTQGDDRFTVSATGVLNVAAVQPPVSLFPISPTVNTPGVSGLTLRGLEGDDIFNVAGNHPYGGGLRVEGGDPSASDVLNFTGGGNAVIIDLAIQTITEVGFVFVDFSGVETLNVNAGTGNITVLGTTGPDNFTVTPTGATTATTTLASLPTLTVNTTNTGASLLTLDPIGGSDLVTVNGQSNNDTIAVVRGGNTTVLVDALKLITLPAASNEALVIASGLGDDVINVTGTGGPATLLVDGGSPTASDTLNIATGAAALVGVNYGTDPATGVVTDNIAGNVTFVDVEHLGLTGSGATSLTINGTNGNDAINQSGNVVTVNNGADVTFATYPTLTLNGNNGDDVINVNPLTLVGVTTFNVNGGDPTASDKLIVNGNATANVIGYNPSDTIGAGNVTITGAPTVNFTTTEAVVIDGQGGTDTLTHATPGSVHLVTFTPGAAPDAGTILTRQAGGGVALVPMSFSHIGAFGLVNFTSAGGREDMLELDGTANSDVFSITGPGNLTQIVTPGNLLFITTLLNTAGISNLEARGLDGDDTFNLTGNLPFATTTIDAGNPSASDVVNLTGAIGNVTIDLAALTVTGYGGTVSLIGVETLNASAAANSIAINGTAGPDNFTVTPTGATTATTTLASLPTLTINTINTGASLLTLNPLGGSDNLRVNGTQGNETITVNFDSVIGNTTGFKTVNYTNTENLQVFGQAGNDTFNVFPAGNTTGNATFFIDGGDPIGSTAGDRINLNPPGAFAIETGPENDEGGLNAAGALRVSWDHIEEVTVTGPGPGLILGTNGDDDITIIARDASTHAGTNGVRDFTVTVNDFFSVLFIDVPTLFVDALAGDDDVVVRAPAPNGADWDVQLTIAGGPPSAVTGDQGDVFELETPGTGADTVTFQPTGSDTGNITLDQGTDSVIQLVNTFSIAALGYISSPGGFEDFVYDGEGDNDNLTIVGTAGVDTIVHTPGAAFDEGRFRINSLLGMTYQNLGNGTITANGGAGTDTLVYHGTAQSDSFTVTPTTGNVTLANANYTHLPVGQQVAAANTIENLVLLGLASDDLFTIAGLLPYLNTLIDGGDPSNSDVLNLSGATGGVATFNLGNQTVSGYGGLISLLGTETVNATGADGTLDTFIVNGYGAFAGGVKFLNLNGADVGGNDGDVGNITATGGLDTITYTPLGASSARFDRSATDAVINITGFNSTVGNLILNAGGSSDELQVVGSSRPDLITLTGNATVTRLTFANNPGGGGLWVPLDFTSVESLGITGGFADDRLDVDNSFGPVTVANGITWDGGAGNDSLRMIGNQAIGSSTYNVGPNVNQGSVVQAGGSTVRVFFNNLEPVIDLVPAADLIVNATNADNAINYTNNGANGLVSIDGFETIEFSNKGNLTLNALSGSDDININSAITPAGLTRVNVNGGDPTGSDDLNINGVAATTTISLANSTIFGATGAGGAVPIVYGTIEAIKAVRGASTTLAVSNSSLVDAIDYSVTPGVALDEGLIQPNTPGTTIPISFKGYSAGTFINLIGDSSDGDDIMTINGTAANDVFTVAATTGNVTITGRATVTPTNIENLTLNGHAGDDTFHVNAVQPYLQTLISGGDPSASDTLNLIGTAGNDTMAVNFFSSQVPPGLPVVNGSPVPVVITGFGGNIGITETESVNFDGNGGTDTLTGNGTAQDDIFTYTPTNIDVVAGTQDEGIFTNQGFNTTFTFNRIIGNFTLNGNSSFTSGPGNTTGADQVIVNATNGPDFMNVDAGNRTVSVENGAGRLLKQVLLGSTVEIVTASSGFGNDTILVIPALRTSEGPGGGNPAVNVPLNLLINVDGGAPNASDALVIAADGNGTPLSSLTDFVVINRSRTPDSGVVRVFRSQVALPDIVYNNVEVVSPILTNGPHASGNTTFSANLLILGPDNYEQNEFINTASFLGNVNTINVTNLAIFPNVNEHRFVPADQDWFRVVAQRTGTLDFQTYFQHYPLLPAAGNLSIEVRDASGDLILNFGDNDDDADERRRIPAVAGQTYFLRVFGATTDVVNGYSLSIINEAPPVPYAMELEDVVVGPLDVTAGASATVFTADPSVSLATTDDFYVGKYVNFLSGNVVGQRSLVTDYVAATRTFTLGTALSATPSAISTFQIESHDTGRSQFDNHTRDRTPTIFFRLDDAILLNDIQGNAPPGTNNPPTGEAIDIPFGNQTLTPGYRIAIFDEGSVPPQISTAPQTPVGFATNVYDVQGNLQQGVYTFTFPGDLSNGSHFLTARVQIIDPSSPTQTGFGDRSVPFEIVVDSIQPPVSFGQPGLAGDGLIADSDSGVSPPNPDTLIDLITNDTTPAFWGRAEANSIVRLYVDHPTLGNPGVFDPNIDLFIGQDTALPIDGSNQLPFGFWTIQSVLNFNGDPPFPLDGLRTVFVTAEDLAGNESQVDSADEILQIFIDTQGPQVFDPDDGGPDQAIQIITDTDVVPPVINTTYNLFGLKPGNAPQGPTPLVEGLRINIRDLPLRVANFFYRAIKEDVASVLGQILVKGDHNGIQSITAINVTNNPVNALNPLATATIDITFAEPLPDDRFTLIIPDTAVIDLANNALDGESNADEPNGEPFFPSGNGIPGGDFVARFTVDSRPEIGMYAAARVSVDINGNLVWDPEGKDNDFTNRDLQFTLGVAPGTGVLPMGIHDAVFAGNFHNAVAPPSGFDKLAAYGFDSTINAFRWLIDINHDGVIRLADGDVVSIQPFGFQIDGIPFAGDWAPGIPGDEIGLYDGTSIWLDTTGNNVIGPGDARIFTSLRGLPLAGDFDGDGFDDFATWRTDTFYFDLAPFGGLPNGNIDHTILFGFPGVSEKPIAADMDQDGITDIGLMVPGRSTITPPELSEWYILQSNDPDGVNRIFGTVNRLDHPFSPVPLGQDLFANFGDEFALPIVGNFDPPVTASTASNLGVVYMAQESTASSITGMQTYSYQTMRAGTLSVDVTSSATAGGLTVQLLSNTHQVIASAVSDAQGRVHFDKALTAASSGFVKVLGSASNVVVHVQNVISENDLLDVDRDGHISAIDLVKLVSRLNTPTQSALSMTAAQDGSIYYDTNQDGYVTAFDLIKVVERLNRPVAPAASSLAAPTSSTAEGTSSDASDIAFATSLQPTKTLLSTTDPASASATAAAVDSVFASEEEDYQADSTVATYATSDDEDDAELVTDLELDWIE